MNNIFSENIRTLRQNMGLNQQDFSSLIGIKQSTLSTYERGNSFPSMEILITISEKCNVSLDWLCGIKQKSQFTTGADITQLFVELYHTHSFDFEINHDIEPSSDRLGIKYNKYNLCFKLYEQNDMYPDRFTINQLATFLDDYMLLLKKLDTMNDPELLSEYEQLWLDKQFQEYSKYEL